MYQYAVARGNVINNMTKNMPVLAVSFSIVYIQYCLATTQKTHSYMQDTHTQQAIFIATACRCCKNATI